MKLNDWRGNVISRDRNTEHKFEKGVIVWEGFVIEVESGN